MGRWGGVVTRRVLILLTERERTSTAGISLSTDTLSMSCPQRFRLRTSCRLSRQPTQSHHSQPALPPQHPLLTHSTARATTTERFSKVRFETRALSCHSPSYNPTTRLLAHRVNASQTRGSAECIVAGPKGIKHLISLNPAPSGSGKLALTCRVASSEGSVARRVSSSLSLPLCPRLLKYAGPLRLSLPVRSSFSG
jgi:hypothetical protein